MSGFHGNDVRDLEDDSAETTQRSCEVHGRRWPRQALLLVVPLLALGLLAAVSWRRRQPSPPRDPAVPAVGDDGRRRHVRRVPALPRRTLARPMPDAFCFTLVGNSKQELPLLRAQAIVHGGVFGCSSWGIFCNPVVKPCTSLLNINTKAVRGGRWHTALNTGIFKALWAQVLSDGVWRKHAWTVKVDTDSVFLPWRMIDHVSGRFDAKKADSKVFFLNCEYGLHGPIEILSRAALQALGNPRKGRGMTTEKCKAPQEDVFLEKCLLSNGVTEIPDYNILDEMACHRDRSYTVDCAKSNVVAFHPFKDEKDWKKCWNTALMHDTAFNPGNTKAKVTGYGNGRRRNRPRRNTSLRRRGALGNGWAP